MSESSDKTRSMDGRPTKSFSKSNGDVVDGSAKQLATWTEASLIGLSPQEHDFQEFKGTAWLMKAPGEIQTDFIFSLSKQVSAFVNGSGGRIFIGLDDHGVVDGGVSTKIKGGGTRAWLEDLLEACVDPKIPKYNVYEVLPQGDRSRIRVGCAVYVLDLPSSPEAPHQAKDHRYYLRIAGKSRPMGHLHVQDILRRTLHPTVLASRFGPFGRPEIDNRDPRGMRVFVAFRTFLINRGRTLARHVGLEVVVPRSLAGKEVRKRMKRLDETHYTQSPGDLRFFRYHPSPLFPSQEVYAATTWICVHRGNLSLLKAGASIDLITYADDANPRRETRVLLDYSAVQRAIDLVESNDSKTIMENP